MLKYPRQQNRVYHFPLDFWKHTFLFGAKFGKLKNPTSTYILWLYGSSLSSFSDSTSLFQLEFGLKIRHMSIILHQTRLLNTSCLPFVANLFNIAVNQRMEAITNPFNQLLLTLINFDQNVRVKVQKKKKKKPKCLLQLQFKSHFSRDTIYAMLQLTSCSSHFRSSPL